MRGRMDRRQHSSMIKSSWVVIHMKERKLGALSANPWRSEIRLDHHARVRFCNIWFSMREVKYLSFLYKITDLSWRLCVWVLSLVVYAMSSCVNLLPQCECWSTSLLRLSDSLDELQREAGAHHLHWLLPNPTHELLSILSKKEEGGELRGRKNKNQKNKENSTADWGKILWNQEKFKKHPGDLRKVIALRYLRTWKRKLASHSQKARRAL